DLNHIQRRASSHTKALALSNGEVVNAGMLANYFAIRGYQFASGVRQSIAALGKIGIKKILVVAAGDEADLLRIGLFGEREAVLASQFANLRLGHLSQRKERSAELLLGEAEEKISLILGAVVRALKQPAP